MSKNRLSALQSEAFILLPDTVQDLDNFVCHPERYLVSLYADPGRAAGLWRERLKRHPYGSEGLLRLSYRGRELIHPALWDEVSGVWFALIDCLQAYLETGRGLSSFPGQPVDVEMRRARAGAVFGVNGDRVLVDPTEFIPGLLDEAERYSRWVEDRIGTLDAPTDQQTGALRQALAKHTR
ncbi:hypothetical protein [Citricoccus sp.]|uniref:hypothetical protein n=1 Tax=Citricoccus sp. TaxID=1978372 RepID=UPI00262715BA|nr:hypothetical protein [Citricoccus sp.]HRO29005.1 hypothetical protein [Citricoccus sp.]